jgi:hypothetical protein
MNRSSNSGLMVHRSRSALWVRQSSLVKYLVQYSGCPPWWAIPPHKRSPAMGWVLRRREHLFRTLKEDRFSTIRKNRHFGKKSPKWAYFPDHNHSEISKSVLFIKKGVLNFSIPLILTRFDRERDKPRPEKCANRRYWRANPPTSRISSGSQLRGGPEFEPDYLTGKTAVLRTLKECGYFNIRKIHPFGKKSPK